MGRIFTTLVFVFLICKATAQTTYVPDDNFEQVLVDLGYDSPPLNNFVLTANIKDVVMLDLNGAGINDLTGIEDFEALEILNCPSNNLSSIDVSQNYNLLELNVSNNNLNQLDVTNNISLRKLGCNTNNLLSLNIMQNTQLRYLACTFNNLSSVNVTQNIILDELFLDNNAINAIDLSENIELTFLSLISNQLTELDITHNINLKVLHCSLNSLNSLNVSQNINLESIQCVGNEINVLDISQNPALDFLNCGSNNLLEINTDNNLNLISLICGFNQIPNLNVTQNILLENLITDYSGLEQLDISLNPNLKQLSCRGNQLESLNVKNGNNTNFQYFNALENPSLTCIEVDDVAYSETNWPDVDPQVEFSEDCNPLGIIDNEIDNLTIYPNPFNDKIFIESSENIKVIQLYDMLGKLELETTQKILELNHIVQGVYILKVIHKNDAVQNFKVIKN